MKRPILLLAFVLAAVVAAGSFVLRAQEVTTLSTPVVKTATTCSIDLVALDLKGSRVAVNLSFNTGDTLTKVYDATTVPTGATLLHNLITANFTITSLIKAAYARLATDGVCVGTVTGTPQ